MSADQIRCYLNVHSSMTSSMKCLHPWMLYEMRIKQTKFVQFSICLCASYCAFLSMLTILLNFSLVAMSNGVSPSWGEKSRRWEPAGGVQGLLGTSTYIVANVDIGVLLQQQRHQTLTLSLADVVKCGIPLLTSQHMSSVSTKLVRRIRTRNVLSMKTNSHSRLRPRSRCCSTRQSSVSRSAAASVTATHRQCVHFFFSKVIFALKSLLTNEREERCANLAFSCGPPLPFRPSANKPKLQTLLRSAS